MKKRFARIRELQSKLAAMRGEGQKLSLEVDTIEAAPADKITDEQGKRLPVAQARITELRGQIEAAQAELDAETEKLERDHAFEQPKAQPQGREIERPRDAIVLEANGFRDLGDFGQAVAMACRPGGIVDPRLLGGAGRPGAAPTNYHESAQGEGYMVPPAFRQEIFELVFNGTDLLGLVDNEPTESNLVHYIADESTPWGSSGIQAYWRGEGQQMTASKVASKLRTLTLHELYAFVLGTQELLEDATRLAARLTKGAANAIRWKASKAVFEGNGAGQPLGFMTSGMKVSQAKTSGQTAATITTANIAAMFARFMALPNGMPRWLANRDTVPQLVQLTIGNQPVWIQPQAGLRDAPGGSIMGIPLEWSEHCETVGTEGDLVLADMKGYYAPQKRSGIVFASSIHLYFDYNIEAFRWTFRMGGQPYLSAPISPNKGSNTKSHFVTLATRS